MSKNDKKNFHILTPATVDNCPGYVDHRGRVFATPKSSKRLEAWKKRMTDKGFTFEG